MFRKKNRRSRQIFSSRRMTTAQRELLSSINRFQRRVKGAKIDVWWTADDGGLTMLVNTRARKNFLLTTSVAHALKILRFHISSLSQNRILSTRNFAFSPFRARRSASSRNTAIWRRCLANFELHFPISPSSPISANDQQKKRQRTGNVRANIRNKLFLGSKNSIVYSRHFAASIRISFRTLISLRKKIAQCDSFESPNFFAHTRRRPISSCCRLRKRARHIACICSRARRFLQLNADSSKRRHKAGALLGLARHADRRSAARPPRSRQSNFRAHFLLVASAHQNTRFFCSSVSYQKSRSRFCAAVGGERIMCFLFLPMSNKIIIHKLFVL